MLFSGASGSTIGRKYYLSKRYRKISKNPSINDYFNFIGSGNLAGLLGIFLGVPFYAICRTIIYYVIDMVKAGRSEKVTNAVLLGNETNTKENNG